MKAVAPLSSVRLPALAPKHAPLRDWRWQLRHRITDPDFLADRLALPLRRRKALSEIVRRYPLAITPYYFSLIDPADPADPILRQCLPIGAELAAGARDAEDPFGESTSVNGSGLIQRYAHRAVFLAHTDCAVRCRHCTRKNTWPTATTPPLARRLAAAVEQVRHTPAITEIIVSGGDPLLLETPVLARILDAFRALPQVAVIRIGTRTPATLPMRIDAELGHMLASRRPLWINTHFNHPRELTTAAGVACERLLGCGIPLSNQTVLLRGVNDDRDTLIALCNGLFRLMVHPYYLFDADPVRGTAHFRVSRRRGRALHAQLRAELSGLALPRYAADVPNWPHKKMLA